MTSDGAGGGGGARLAIFSVVRNSVEDVQRWARAAGHEVVLLVTTPTRQGYEAAATASGAASFVSSEVGDCAPLLRALAVDLGIVCAFGRIPESLFTLPREGIVNLHPALLPEYRGPNPFRALFDGVERTGYTLHRVVAEIDAGPILARTAFDVPDPADPAVLAGLWSAALTAVLAEGVPKALAGDPGAAQEASVTGRLAGRFTEAERVLDWELPARVIELRAAGLLMAGLQPQARIGSAVQDVRRIRRLPGVQAKETGTITVDARRALVAVSDGVLEVDLGPLPR